MPPSRPKAPAQRTIYLDYNATTPIAPDVATAMQPFLSTSYGNPSSAHRLGTDARIGIERARRQVARLIGCAAQDLVFTGGGTEADNLAVKGVAFAAAARGLGRHVVTSASEHKAVLNAVEDLRRYHGFEATIVGVDAQGRVDPAAVAAALRPDTVLVSIMFANNEVGTIQPVAAIGRLCREHGVPFHCDGVQACGQVPVDVGELGVDLLSLSGHKFYAPKGIGALFVREGIEVAPLISGGSQERGLRAGTENTAAIVGLGAAAELAADDLEAEVTRKTALREKLWAVLKERVSEIELNGHPTERLPGTLHVSIPGASGQRLVVTLSTRAGICCSAGSACSSETGPAPVSRVSHVLEAMGMPPDATRGSLRLSIGRYTTEEDVAEAGEMIPAMVALERATMVANAGTG